MSKVSSSPWWVYLVLTESECLYTGITTDPERRFQEHLATHEGAGTKGAKFFRGHKPVKLVYREAAENRSEATKREIAIKKLPRNKKWQLITNIHSERAVNYISDSWTDTN
jgi:putative endonuclease